MPPLVVVQVALVQDVHMDIVVATGWGYAFDDAFSKFCHDLERLLWDVSCYKVFDVSFSETAEIPFQIVESDDDALRVRMFFKEFVDKPYA